MLKNPKVGMQCWIITDLWETLCAVSVKIIAENPESGEFVCRWQITEEYSEDYEGRTPEVLYETERAARLEIEKQRRLESERNGLFGGQDHGRSALPHEVLCGGA